MNLFSKVKYQLLIALLVSIIILIILVWKGEPILGASANTIIVNLFSAIIASIIVGIYFDISAKESFQNDIRSVLSVNPVILESGIDSYHPSWDSVDLRPYMKQSRSFDIYVYYGSTFFKSYEQAIEEFLSKKHNRLRVFISNEENKFLEASSVIWEIGNQNDNLENIKGKLRETIDLIKSLVEKMRNKGSLKGKIEVYSVLIHPTNFSFYRFDKNMIIVLNKLSYNRSPKPPVLVLKKNENENCLFNRISEDFATLFESNKNFLHKIEL